MLTRRALLSAAAAAPVVALSCEAVAAPHGGCGCAACKVGLHRSDCAVHNEPAYPNGSCDCGALTADKWLDELWPDAPPRWQTNGCDHAWEHCPGSPVSNLSPFHEILHCRKCNEGKNGSRRYIPGTRRLEPA